MGLFPNNSYEFIEYLRLLLIRKVDAAHKDIRITVGSWKFEYRISLYSFSNSEETFQVGEKLMWKLGEFFIE